MQLASAIEVPSMSLPNSSAQETVSYDKEKDSRRAGEAVMNLVEKGIKLRDIMTRKSFENAVTVVIAIGGSTNAVLCLLVMAYSVNVKPGRKLVSAQSLAFTAYSQSKLFEGKTKLFYDFLRKD